MTVIVSTVIIAPRPRPGIAVTMLFSASSRFPFANKWLLRASNVAKRKRVEKTLNCLIAEQLAGMAYKSGGPVLYEEVAVAEAPEHRDAGQLGIAGRLDIHIAVAHVDGVFN